MPTDKDKTGASFSVTNPATHSYAWVLQILGLALAYFVSGKLGTFLAIPPGYATAIWPPSGIALAGILLYGYRVWPGIFLGSFLVNISTTLVASAPSELLTSITITLAISAGASLQAITGVYLVRRHAGFPNALTHEKDVFLFLLFGGLLASLVNSTIAVSALAATARIPLANFLPNWGTWWLGDILGIFIFTPLVLAWLYQPGEAWRDRRLAISLPILAMFMLTTAAVFYESQNESQRLKLDFEQHAAELNLALEKSLGTHLNVLRFLGSFYAASNAVDREEFKSFVAQALRDFPGIQALGWDPLIRSSERDAFETRLKQQGYANSQITERTADKQLARATNRPEYVPVSFIEPYQGNETALGYDVYSDPLRREAIDKARDSGEIATTAPIRLVQEKGSQQGILAFLPIYHNGLPHQTLEQRRTNITGYVVGVFRGGDIVTAALKTLDQKELSYRLIDESAAKTEQLLFSSDSNELTPLVVHEDGLFGKNKALASNFVIPVGGRSWRFEVIPTQEFFAQHHSANAWLILLGGLILTSMTGVFTLVSSGRGNLLWRLVEERTAELSQSEARFRATFEAAPVGVAIVSLDGQLLQMNQNYCDFIGYNRDELLTMTFRQLTHPDYHQSDVDIIKRTLAGEMSSYTLEKQFVRKKGELIWGSLTAQLIRDVDGLADHFIVVVENIEQRKLAEAQIASSLSLLNATLNSTRDAILVVNLLSARVLHNQRFVDLWQIPDAILATQDDSFTLPYLQNQVEDGDVFLAKVQQLYATPEASSYDTLKLKNGKIIERYSIPQRIAGRVVGRVWSFCDITERVLADKALKKESEKNLTLLRNASDGIHILDYDGNIIEASDSFCAMLGYRRNEMIGMNVVRWDAAHSATETIQLVRQQFGQPTRSLFETRHRRQDGSVFDVEISGLPLELDGKPALFNSSRDISKRKEIEDSLIKLSLAVEQNPNSIVITNLDANIEYVNEAFVKTTGYSREEIIGQNPRLLHSGKTPAAIHEEMWATLSRGEVWQGELINKKRNGDEYTEAALISPVRNADGNITHYLGIKEDISARKQAELLAQEAEQRFRIVANAAPVLIWLADTDKLCFWFNQTWLDFTGRALEQEVGNGWAEGVNPEDLQRCLAIYVGHFDRRVPFQMEYRLKHNDGEYRWVHDNGVPRFDAEGIFVGYIGSCTDITDMRQAQAELQTSHDLFTKLSRQVPGMVYQFRLFPDGHFSFPFVSDGIREIYEVTPEQVSEDATAVFAVLHPDDYDRIVATIQESALTLKPWQLEYRVKLAKKGVRWLSGLAQPEKLMDGSTLWHGFITDISERHEREHQFGLYHRLFELTSDCVYMISPKQDFKFVFVNDATCRHFGVEREQLLKWRIPDWDDNFKNQADLDTLWQEIKTSKGFMVETSHRVASGHEIPVEVSGNYLSYQGEEYIAGYFHDITERKRLEKELLDSYDFNISTLNSLTSQIAVLDAEGVIVAVNSAWERFGEENGLLKPLHTMIGCNYLDTCKDAFNQVDGDEASAAWIGIKSVLTGKQDLFKLEYPCHSPHQKRWFRMSVTPLQNACHGVVVSHENVTQRKQAEQALLEARDAAVALAQSKSEFLANMSHEIRTPMNAIIGLSQLALNKTLTFEIRDYLEKIYSSSNSLLSILNDILDFSKLEAGHSNIEHSNFDLDVVHYNLNNLFRSLAEQKALGFNIEIAPDVPHNLIGDSLRLQQILINLLGNALKFTEQGSVSLDISITQIDQSQVRLLFSVTDTGIGMSAADLEKLFQPFSQVDASITRRFGGTGLGLAISQELLQLMGSQFSVTSAPDQGSRFSFELIFGVPYLPLPDRSDLPHPALVDTHQLLIGKLILVVEDNLINQQVVSELLRLSGISVEIANNGEEALEWLKLREFDAVLMDIHMPVLDGFAATQRIRSQARFADLPVIALTAGVTKEEQDKCLASGMNDFTAKPINPEKLLATLLHWLIPVEVVTATAKPQPEKPASINDLPGFDLHKLLVMLANNQQLATQLLLSFRDSMITVPDEIEAMVTAGNQVSARELTHKIKGASGNIGAMQLYAATTKLEAELGGEHFAVEFNNFKLAFNQTMTGIATLYKAEELLSLSSKNIEAQMCCAAELDSLLKGNDFISEAMLNTLKPHLTSPQLDLFSLLRRQINALHYAEARQTLKQLTELTPLG